MKSSIACLALVMVVLCSPVMAQQSTNEAKLKGLSEKFDKRHSQRKIEAEEYAQTHGIPLRKDHPNGKLMELQFIANDRPVYYETHNVNAAITTRTNSLWSSSGLGLNLDGAGYSQLGLWDGAGVNTRHQEFIINNGKSRIKQQDKPYVLSDHSTHVAGTLVAAGVIAEAKGMAYNGTLKAWDWTNDESEMSRAASKGLEISSHSYGYAHGWTYEGWAGDESVDSSEDYWFGFYTEFTQELDEIAYNAPAYLMVRSAGNDREDLGDGTHPPDGNEGTGYDCIGTRGTAKNILTVGAVNDVTDFSGPAGIVMSEFSSWGPCDDGRIKPDIVANGVGLTSPVAISNSSYAVYTGTSMSAPNVAGSLALLQEHYQNTHEGQSMRASTLKALAIHTADEAGPSPGPDYMFGWGLLNANAAAAKISEDNDSYNVIDEVTLNSGELYTRDITANDIQPIVVTIVWTDLPGIPVDPSLDPENPMLINDLDLRIKGDDISYYPWKLERDHPDSPATNDDENNVDNVEMVFIESPTPGEVYTIEVSHDGILIDPQHFSIIVSGTEGTINDPVYCTSNGNAVAEWISMVKIGNQTSNSGTSEAIGYQDLTTIEFKLTGGINIPLNLVPEFGSKTKFEFWSIWIDLNGDGDFLDDLELIGNWGKSKSAIDSDITIPDVEILKTRMRVSMSRKGFTDPCEIFQYGEVEDYTVSISTIPISGSGGKTEIVANDFTSFSEELSVYPNPAENIININYQGELRNTSLILYSVQGKKIVQQEINSTYSTLDISKLSPGLYYLVINTGDRLINEKIVKQ